MIRRNRSVIAELLVLIIIVIYASLVPSSDLSFAQNSDIRDNGSIRGSLLIVQVGVAHRTPEEAHSMKLEIMTEYFLDDNNDEIVVDNGLALGHFSLDDSEGIYFIKFSMLKILKISQDLTTIVFHGNAWEGSDNANEISLANALVTVSGKITYNEPINFRDDSVTNMISEKSNIQVSIRDDSGQPMKLSSRGTMNGMVSTNIIPNPSEIQGESFILQTSNGDKFTVYATDPETIQLLTDNYYSLNNMFVSGRLVIGNGGFNSPWSWHLDPDDVTMAEFAIELCDGTA